MRRPSCCQTFLASLLKFLNFLQAFVGISILVYSLWMLNQWNHHAQIPPSSAPSPDSFAHLLLNSDVVRASDHSRPFNMLVNIVSGVDQELGFDLSKLPSPWFIYSFMGLGVVLCLITCVGHIGAEGINGCCLCFYTLLMTLLLLIEAALVAFILFDLQWNKDLPNDPTGELASLQSFIKENRDICKWVGITVIIIQALSLLLAMVLRATVSAQRADNDNDDDYAVLRQPLVNPQLTQASGTTAGEIKGIHSDIWSTRTREKYGLNPGDVKYNLGDHNLPIGADRSSEEQRRCSIL